MASNAPAVSAFSNAGTGFGPALSPSASLALMRLLNLLLSCCRGGSALLSPFPTTPLLALLADVGYEWHQDGGGSARFLTLLHCKEACEGADTLFADGAVLFNRLSTEDQQRARSPLPPRGARRHRHATRTGRAARHCDEIRRAPSRPLGHGATAAGGGERGARRGAHPDRRYHSRSSR